MSDFDKNILPDNPYYKEFVNSTSTPQSVWNMKVHGGASNCGCNKNVYFGSNEGTTNNHIDKLSVNNLTEIEDNIDYNFMMRIKNAVTQSCAIPLPVPIDRFPEIILQAAQYFWENDDTAVHEKYYIVRNCDICKNGINKTVQLPPQIINVYGVNKCNGRSYGAVLGDFSLERMFLNSYSSGGLMGGSLYGMFSPNNGTLQLSDMVVGLYELSTFEDVFSYPITYDYNSYSSQLTLLGDLQHSDLVISCFVRCRIQDLYKSGYFFRYCVALVKRSLATIMGTFSFKLPGGVEINYESFREEANDEITKIEDWIETKNRSCGMFFVQNSN